MWNSVHFALYVFTVVYLVKAAVPPHSVTALPPVHLHSQFTDLHKTLMKLYDKAQLPIITSGEAIKMGLGFVLVNIVEVDEANDQIQLNGWLDLQWVDHRLVWDKHNIGFNHTLIAADKIWLPDLILYKSTGDVFPLENVKHHVGVSSEGEVTLWTPIRPRFSCLFPTTEPEGGVHTCSLEFGSWTHNGFMLDFELYHGRDTIKIDHLIPNKNWELLSTKAERKVKRYDCCPEFYSSIEFSFDFKHRPATA